jgi:hypothetical protein
MGAADGSGPRLRWRPTRRGCGSGFRELGRGGPRLEADDLAVRRSAVFGLELAVEKAMRRTQLVGAARFRDHVEFDLRAVAEVIGAAAEALAAEELFLTMGESAKA